MVLYYVCDDMMIVSDIVVFIIAICVTITMTIYRRDNLDCNNHNR